MKRSQRAPAPKVQIEACFGTRRTSLRRRRVDENARQVRLVRRRKREVTYLVDTRQVSSSRPAPTRAHNASCSVCDLRSFTPACHREGPSASTPQARKGRTETTIRRSRERGTLAGTQLVQSRLRERDVPVGITEVGSQSSLHRLLLTALLPALVCGSPSGICKMFVSLCWRRAAKTPNSRRFRRCRKAAERSRAHDHPRTTRPRRHTKQWHPKSRIEGFLCAERAS